MADELTQGEIDRHMPLKFSIMQQRDGAIVGIKARYFAQDFWQITVMFFLWDIHLTRISFHRYEERLIAMGPYRNA